MNIAVTGASGFLGSRLVGAWRASGHRVTASVSGPGGSDGTLAFRLGQPLAPGALAGIDVVVHGAHAFGRGMFDVNVEGTRSLFREARSAGARRQILVGSASALPDSASEYGRIKYELERFFLGEGETVVRPGLVIGAGGMFGRIIDKVLRVPVVPLLDGGRDPVPIVGIDEFVAAMTTILERDCTGLFHLHHPEPVSMRELLETLARLGGRRRLFVSLPTGLAERLLVGIENMGIPFPVGSDSLRSVRQRRGSIPGASDLPHLIGAASTLEALLAASLEEARGRVTGA